MEIYDSVHSSAGTHVKAQITCLLNTKHAEIELTFMDVMKQSGEADCGLFTIAYATALALREDPCRCMFDQQKMRQIYRDAWKSPQMTMFPVKKLRQSQRKVKTFDYAPVFCTCRMVELPGTSWIECTKCREWFHPETCVSVLKSALQSKASWFCSPRA